MISLIRFLQCKYDELNHKDFTLKETKPTNRITANTQQEKITKQKLGLCQMKEKRTIILALRKQGFEQ